MKNVVRFILFVGFILIGMSISAQEIKVNDTIYEVKKGLIFKDGVDVTNTLTVEEKTKILAEFKKQKQKLEEAEADKEKAEKAEKAEEKAQKEKEKAEKEQKKAEKEQKKAEKEQKKAEKERKKAEKVLKQKEKAQSNFDKATKKYNDAQNKYEKLKSKGKLSPVDEEKWLEKIEKLNANIAKTKKKLK